MSYIDNNLLVSEHVIYRTKLHWIIFSTLALWLLLALVCFSLGHFFIYLGYIMLAIACYDFCVTFIRFKCAEFAVTNKRVMIKVGFISRNIVETFLQKVEGIMVNQTILGRLFNFGTIVICGTGGSRDHFRNIDDPLIFRKAVQQQIELAMEKTTQ